MSTSVIVCFVQSTFYMEGNLGHPVFQTPWGKLHNDVKCFAVIVYLMRVMYLLIR